MDLQDCLREEAAEYPSKTSSFASGVQRQDLQRLAGASEAEVEEYLGPRHVVDVLSDFPAAKPPLEKLLRSLRPLQPRLYSISSSPLENPHHVQVECAILSFFGFILSTPSLSCAVRGGHYNQFLLLI